MEIRTPIRDLDWVLLCAVAAVLLLGASALNTEDGTIVGDNKTALVAATELLRNCRRLIEFIFLFLRFFKFLTCLSSCKLMIILFSP